MERATLADHMLIFHKRSTDGSAKCDAFPALGQSIFGVLYEIDASELDDLRDAEGVGHGYDERSTNVQASNGNQVRCVSYYASPSHIDATLLPYTWYYDFVTSGCYEHALPDAYVAEFVSPVVAVDDPKPGRDLQRRCEVKGDPVRKVP